MFTHNSTHSSQMNTFVPALTAKGTLERFLRVAADNAHTRLPINRSAQRIGPTISHTPASLINSGGSAAPLKEGVSLALLF
jgi:hypothetical protein